MEKAWSFWVLLCRAECLLPTAVSQACTHRVNEVERDSCSLPASWDIDRLCLTCSPATARLACTAFFHLLDTIWVALVNFGWLWLTLGDVLSGGTSDAQSQRTVALLPIPLLCIALLPIALVPIALLPSTELDHLSI